MTDRNAQYQATYRRRSAFNAQATLLGWTKLELLSAFITGEGELVVIDKEGGRYGTDAERIVAAVESPDTLVTPAAFPDNELGTRWQRNRAKFGAALAELDLSETTHADALKTFEVQASALLRAVEILRANTGPDWQEAIGITS